MFLQYVTLGGKRRIAEEPLLHPLPSLSFSYALLAHAIYQQVRLIYYLAATGTDQLFGFRLHLVSFLVSRIALKYIIRICQIVHLL